MFFSGASILVGHQNSGILMMPLVPIMTASFGYSAFPDVLRQAILSPGYFQIELVYSSTPSSFNPPITAILSGEAPLNTSCVNCRAYMPKSNMVPPPNFLDLKQ
jgi:hypothetical protein